jgi:hypothetical protein
MWMVIGGSNNLKVVNIVNDECAHQRMATCIQGGLLSSMD